MSISLQQFLNLPYGVLYEHFLYLLDVPDILSIRQTCRRFEVLGRKYIMASLASPSHMPLSQTPSLGTNLSFSSFAMSLNLRYDKPLIHARRHTHIDPDQAVYILRMKVLTGGRHCVLVVRCGDEISVRLSGTGQQSERECITERSIVLGTLPRVPSSVEATYMAYNGKDGILVASSIPIPYRDVHMDIAKVDGHACIAFAGGKTIDIHDLETMHRASIIVGRPPTHHKEHEFWQDEWYLEENAGPKENTGPLENAGPEENAGALENTGPEENAGPLENAAGSEENVQPLENAVPYTDGDHYVFKALRMLPNQREFLVIRAKEATPSCHFIELFPFPSMNTGSYTTLELPPRSCLPVTDFDVILHEVHISEFIPQHLHDQMDPKSIRAVLPLSVCCVASDNIVLRYSLWPGVCKTAGGISTACADIHAACNDDEVVYYNQPFCYHVQRDWVARGDSEIGEDIPGGLRVLPGALYPILYAPHSSSQPASIKFHNMKPWDITGDGESLPTGVETAGSQSEGKLYTQNFGEGRLSAIAWDEWTGSLSIVEQRDPQCIKTIRVSLNGGRAQDSARRVARQSAVSCIGPEPSSPTCAQNTSQISRQHVSTCFLCRR
ncbi:hypothetical protein FA95DRAFT_1575058 [Auriscalpium vulgare]|uniref:Uncharacterized protein n=1 Tax=Auriscalpium vulgare TaxID=40419 RepID=A0ACB8RH95_9AGAM|nr:hypothetical protein FA95DRAFT_1575058 [Auriscalpium vulgare]